MLALPNIAMKIAVVDLAISMNMTVANIIPRREYKYGWIDDSGLYIYGDLMKDHNGNFFSVQQEDFCSSK